MTTEFETKVLDIDVAEIERKLLALGAKREPEVLMKRWIFDIDPSKDEWIRLRDNGHKTTITYKCKSGSGISETEEMEVEVGNFEKAAEILSKLEFKGKYYQESKRVLFKFRDIEFTIDTWPKLPSYLEIESSSEERVKEGLTMLKLQNKDVGNLSIKGIYSRYGIDLHSFKSIKF
ncbi:MAG: class IV adenylate cyclase [Candidatus Diapherotrites archaeon]|nr:class IV adenylate cyclase [Candidatus Diapherotrites archaeon]